MRAAAAVAVAVSSMTLACAAGAADSQRTSVDDAARGIDSLNVRLSAAYREHDPAKYEALFTDSAVFEWPAFKSPHGRAAMGAMARENWAALRDMDLKLTVASRHIAGDQATEFGAFEQSWAGDSGRRSTEYGRYATLFLRQPNGEWLMHHFLGFEDSTRARTGR